MAKFKFMNVLVAAALLAGFSSCSQDDEIVAGGEEAKNLGYAQIMISVPSNASTRTDAEGGDSAEIGSENENAVKTARLYFVNPTTNTVASVIDVPSFSTTDEVVFTSDPIAIEKGEYDMYVIANATANGIVVGSSEASLQEEIVEPTPYFATVPTTGLKMASRSSDASKVRVNIIGGTETTPQKLATDIERTEAKITLKGSADYAYVLNDINNAKVADIKITGYSLKNINTTAFTFRHVNQGDFTIGNTPSYYYGNVTAGTTATDYVMDPKTYLKTLDTAETEGWFTTASTNMPFNTKGSEVIVGFLQENTMHVSAQKKGYATAMVFNATITPAESIWASDAEKTAYTTGNDLFYFNGKFYSQYTTVVSVVNAQVGTNVLPADTDDDNAISQMATYQVSWFVGGTCTYPYYIKHMENNKTPEMGIMEYAIVRNNVYKVNVTGIKALGDSETTTTDPNEDIESSIAIDVTLTVKPWIVRANDAVLGR